jgi:hypothetical protein
VLIDELPPAVRDNVLAYVGCIAGAWPLGDYLRELLAAGFTGLSLPSVTSAAMMVEGLDGATASGDGGAPLDPADVSAAGRALVSAVFAAQKPR